MKDFQPHPRIALGKSNFDPKKHDTYYLRNYVKIFKDIASGELKEIDMYRQCILEDLWFIVYFILGIPEEKKPNHPFVVARCNDVRLGPKDFTLDVWAREHYKSSIMTIAETIQDSFKNPEEATGIFSHKASIAKKFLFEIKQHFENSEVLKACFPDVLWENPKREAPIWSLDEGLVLRRTSNRRETTIAAFGLVEGMPVGLHLEKRKYDDIVTKDIADSIDVMEKVKDAFDVSQNLGTEEGTHRVEGTFYNHNDPLVYIRDKKDPITGDPMYKFRLHPATIDGLPNGKPVLISEKRLNKLRGDRSFYCQQLCNPTPRGSERLNPALLKEIDPNKIPMNIVKFMVIDSAGELRDRQGDSWGVHVIGVEPKVKEIGTSNIYIMQSFIDEITESAAVDMLSKMYLEGGMIRQVGYERVLNMTPAWLVHFVNYVAQAGRYISIDPKLKMIIPLSHGGRNKTKRIESALSWPLNNGCIHISTAIPYAYRQRLKNEMEKFPFWEDDGLDSLSYLYDMLQDFDFAMFKTDDEMKILRAQDKKRHEYDPFNRARR